MATYSEVKREYLNIFTALDSPRWFDVDWADKKVYGVEVTGTYHGFVFPVENMMGFNDEKQATGYFHLFTALLIYVSRSYPPDAAAALMASLERNARPPGSRYFMIPFFIRYFITRYQVRKCLKKCLVRICQAQFQRCGSHTIEPMADLFSYAGFRMSDYRKRLLTHPSLLIQANKQASVG